MSKKFIAFMIFMFVLVGGGFLYVLRWGSSLPFGGPNLGESPLGGTVVTSANQPAPQPSVTLSIYIARKGNQLIVHWMNLPGNTKSLLIYRSPKGKNQWTLWKTIAMNGNLADGETSFNIGSATFDNYSFFVQATEGGGNGTNSAGQNILWTSNVQDANTTTTPPDTGNNGSGSNNSNSNSSSTNNTNNNSNNNNSSTTNGTNNTSTATSSQNNNNNGGNGTSSAPQGTPYYTPQSQLSGYGQAQSGNFWVQHVDQKIQIGWQNLPPPTTEIVIYRSPNQDGPWNAVLTQENPGVSGAYSLQVVDDTLGQPFYYEMYANAGTTTIQTYGPVYLPPVGQ